MYAVEYTDWMLVSLSTEHKKVWLRHVASVSSAVFDGKFGSGRGSNARESTISNGHHEFVINR